MHWINVLFVAICAIGFDSVVAAYMDRDYYRNARASTYNQYENNDEPDYVPTPNGGYRGRYRSPIGREYGGYGPYYNQQLSSDYLSGDRYNHRGGGASQYNQHRGTNPSNSQFKKISRDFEQRSYSDDTFEKKQSDEDTPVDSNRKIIESSEQKRKRTPARAIAADVQKKRPVSQQEPREQIRTKITTEESRVPALRPTRQQLQQRILSSEKYVESKKPAVRDLPKEAAKENLGGNFEPSSRDEFMKSEEPIVQTRPENRDVPKKAITQKYYEDLEPSSSEEYMKSEEPITQTRPENRDVPKQEIKQKYFEDLEPSSTEEFVKSEKSITQTRPESRDVPKQAIKQKFYEDLAPSSRDEFMKSEKAITQTRPEKRDVPKQAINQRFYENLEPSSRDEFMKSEKSITQTRPENRDVPKQATKQILFENSELSIRRAKDSNQVTRTPINIYNPVGNENSDDDDVTIEVEDETIEIENEQPLPRSTTVPKSAESKSFKSELTKPKGPEEGSRIETPTSDIPAFPPGYPTGPPQTSLEFALYDTKEDQCSMQPNYGNCKGRFLKWYYDHDDNECKEFIFSGCGGNSNMFLSLEDCADTCLITEQESNDDVFDDSTDSDEEYSMDTIETSDTTYEEIDDIKEVPDKLDAVAKTILASSSKDNSSSTEVSTLCGGCGGVPGTIQRPCTTSLATTCTDLKAIYRVEQCGPYKKDTCRIPDYSSYTYPCAMTVGKCCQCSRVLPDGYCEVPSCGEFGEWSPCCKECGYTRMRFKTCMHKGYPWARCIFTESELCLPEDLPQTTSAISSDTLVYNSTTAIPASSNVKSQN